MWSLWIKCSVLCAFVMVIHGGEFGHGKWELMEINKCEKEDYKFKFDLKLIKINDTHDGFSGHIVAEEPLTEEIGVCIELYKYEEEQWKKFQMIFDDSLYDFFNKLSKESVDDFMASAGIESTELPIAEGEYDINNFVLNHMPNIGMNGTYRVMTLIIDSKKVVGCIEVLTAFKKDDKDEE